MNDRLRRGLAAVLVALAITHRGVSVTISRPDT
jgi:hypothetical protein